MREHLKRLTMDFFSISVFCFKKTKQKTCHNSLTTPSIACVCSSGLAHLIISAPRWFPGHYCCSKKKKKKTFKTKKDGNCAEDLTFGVCLNTPKFSLNVKSLD